MKRFKKKYEKAPENPNLYCPKGGAQEFLFLKENVEFIASWGKKMSILKGGVLSIFGRKNEDISTPHQAHIKILRMFPNPFYIIHFILLT
ncbi:MAG: hypothetical protein ACI4QM_00165 [Alphaproteobacteria bacterium]